MNVDNKIVLVSSGSTRKSKTRQMEKTHGGETAFHKDGRQNVLGSQSRMPQRQFRSGLEGCGAEGVALQVGTRSCVSQAMMATCFLLWAISGLSMPPKPAEKDGG